MFPKDRFGNPATPQIIETDSATGITYWCYRPADIGNQQIIRETVTVVGTVTTTTYERSIGEWANRAALTYTAINEF